MKKKICFVALGSYPLFTSDETLTYVGGAELKQVLIGYELVKRGYDVSFITYDEKGEKKAVFKDIRIIKTFTYPNALHSFRKVRVLWKALRTAHSDVYIQAGGVLGLVALFCFVKRKKYVKWIASDENLLLKTTDRKTPFLFKILLYLDFKIARMVIAQNEQQRQVIGTRFKKKNVVIKNPVLLQDKSSQNMRKQKEKCGIWISTIRSIKQPELFLRIAQTLPDFQFLMIGGEYAKEKEVFEKIQQEAYSIPNLKFLGFVPYDKIQRYYNEASLLVNTSKTEGFPNTFLEAWVHAIPVVSLNCDPDEIICQKKLGLHSKTFDRMILDIKNLMIDESFRSELGMNAKKYVEETHDINKITTQFIDLLESL